MLEEKLADGRRVALLQRNFVSMASHEFRTPFTSIDAHAQRLLKVRDRIAEKEFAERIGKIRKAVLRLTNLINNMIETSRIDERDAELYFHPTNWICATCWPKFANFIRKSPRGRSSNATVATA